MDSGTQPVNSAASDHTARVEYAAPDHYQLLGLPRYHRASPDVVQRQAQEVRQMLAPSLSSARPETVDIVEQRLQEACETLSDPELQQAYDRSLRDELLLEPATRAEHRRRWKVAPGATEEAVAQATEPRFPAGESAGGHGGQSAAANPANHPAWRAGAADAERNPQQPSPIILPDQHPNYHILGEIARGQNSVVYEAYERTLGRYVAIKQLTTCAGEGSREADLFWREARFLAELRHEKIVRVHAVDVPHKWIIMERMKGSVRDLLQQDLPVKPELVRSVLRQALEGLQYLHERGKIHGEIKPSRLLIDDQGCVRISHSPGRMLGGEFRVPAKDQRHVAPELLKPDIFGEMGPGVDLYCLAFVALEMLVGPDLGSRLKGVALTGAQSAVTWFRWHSSPSENLPDVQELAPEAPQDLAFILQRMARKHVDERYASAKAVLEDLGKSPLVLVNLATSPFPRTASNQADDARRVSVNAPSNLVPRHRQTDTPRHELRDWLADLWQHIAIRQQLTRHPYGAALLAAGMFILLAMRWGNSPETGSVQQLAAQPDSLAVDNTFGSAAARPHTSASDAEDWVDTQPTDAKSDSDNALESETLTPSSLVSVLAPDARPVSADALAEADMHFGTPPPTDQSDDVTFGDSSRSRPEQAGDNPRDWQHMAPSEPPWPLPGRLTSQQKADYVRAVRRMLNAITGPGVMAAKRAAEANYLEARTICAEDPRAYHAFALVLMEQYRNREAHPHLLETVRLAPTTYLSPYRHLLFNMAVLYEEDYAAAECVRFIRITTTLHPALISDELIAYHARYAGTIMGWLECLGGQSGSGGLCEAHTILQLLDQHSGTQACFTENRESMWHAGSSPAPSSGNEAPHRRALLESHISINFHLHADALLATFPEENAL